MPTSDVRLVPKTSEEAADWLPVAMAAYEEARMRAGDTPEGAAAGRRASEERFFPDGRLVDGQLLFTIVAAGEEAGWLWIGPMEDPSNWYVWDVAVHEAFRGRGIGEATMLLAEDVARSHGASVLRLNVFAYNDPAIRLYGRLGYATDSMHLHKDL